MPSYGTILYGEGIYQVNKQELRGSLATLSIDGEPFGESRNFNLVFTVKNIDVTSRDSDRWGEYLFGRRDWTAIFLHLYIASDVAKKILMAHYADGTPIAVTALITYEGQTFTGTADMKTYAIGFPFEGVVEASGTLRGTGPITLNVT